LSVCLLGTLH